MAILFKLSFIISGIFIRDIIYFDSMQVSEIFFFIFIAASVYQYIYVFIINSRENNLNFRLCLAKLALYYTITVEAAVVITAVLNFNFNRTAAQGLFTTPPPEPNLITIIISTCIAYQVMYYIIKRIKK